jgi:hypothetical protein
LPDAAALIGQAMMVAGGVIIVVALGWLLPRVLRVRSRARALEATIEAGQLDVESAMRLLVSERAQSAALLEPWRRLLRWARHPLVVAGVEWYLRRRRRA